MAVRLSCASARELLRLEPAAAGRWTRSPDVVFCLERDEDIARRFGEGETSLPPERLEATVLAALRGAPAPSAGGYFHAYHRRLAAILNRRDQTGRLLDVLATAGVSELEPLVLARLPAGARLAADVAVVPNNHGDAYVHQGRVIISLSALAVQDGRPVLAAGGRVRPVLSVLAHELHHLGQSSLPRPGLEPGLACARDLLGGLVGEGAATLFFTLPRDPAWEKAMAAAGGHLRQLEAVVRRVLAGELAPEQATTLCLQAFYRSGEHGHAPIYAMGVTLCRAVRRAAGDPGVLDLLARPLTAFGAYNRASGPFFDPALAARLAGAS